MNISLVKIYPPSHGESFLLDWVTKCEKIAKEVWINCKSFHYIANGQMHASNLSSKLQAMVIL